MFRKKILTAALFLVIPAMSEAQTTPYTGDLTSLSLKNSIQIGLENNRTLKKALMDEEKAGYQRKEILGSGLPQIKLAGGYNNFINVFPQAVPGGLFGDSDPNGVDVIALGVPHSIKAGLEANQLLFSSSYIIGLKAAKTSEEFYRLLAEQSEEEVIYDISMNYLGALQMILQKENLLANIDELKGLEKILKAQVANDLVRKVDLSRVTVNLSTLESELENLEIGIHQRKNYLKLLMGVAMDIELDLDNSVIEEYYLDSDLPLEELIAEDRKDLQVLAKQRALLELDYKNIRSAKHPTLVAFGDINRNAFSNQFDFLREGKVWYQGFLVGVKLEIPVFDGFTTKARASQNRVSLRQLEEDRKMATDAAEMEYENATKKYFNSIKTLKAMEDNLDLASEVLQETRLLYGESLSPLTDLLEAESTQRKAQANYNNQLIQTQIAKIEILKSTGNIKNIIL